MLEVWSNRLTEDGGKPWGLGNDLLIATRTDLDSALATVEETYVEGGVTAIVRDWFTGEETWLTGAHKRRQSRKS